MKKILIFLICLIPLNVFASTSKVDATFVRCVDGDTAVFNVDGNETKFRFLAIDTPETVHPTKDVEAYGKDASEYTCNKLTNATSIIIEYEDSNKTDKYGRSLGWIWVDGSLLQDELIKVGYAKVAYIYGNYKYTNSLCVDEKVARENVLGLWNDNTDDVYCDTVDLTNVKYNISLDSSEEETSNNTTNVTVEDVTNTLNEISNTVDNVENLFDGNNTVIIYLFMGAAVVAAIYEQFKRR